MYSFMHISCVRWIKVQVNPVILRVYGHLIFDIDLFMFANANEKYQYSNIDEISPYNKILKIL